MVAAAQTRFHLLHELSTPSLASPIPLLASLLKMFVKEENGEESVVTVRLYGPNTDYIINHMRVPKLAAKIAKELCRFHAVEIPGSKEPQLWNEISKFYESGTMTCNVCNLMMLRNKEHIRRYPLKNFMVKSLKSSPSPLGLLLTVDHTVTEVSTLGITSTSILVKKNKDHIFMHYLELDKPDEVSSKELEVLYIDSNAFMLASHIVWALWALIQATMPPINFDYLGYFFLCYNKYISKKETNCLLALAYLSGLNKA
ncbi:unnamed protein product [Linum tenue]|uniref:ethanolamine kinase n=1 Tax=Linum tenue TaxID=586396 RepID=A0AAV0LAM3_9ROSI|nr:unnamed protein product [Linum tenue]